VAFREVDVVEIREVLRGWLDGGGLRRIAERAGVDRKTARRYVEAAQAAGLVRDAGPEALCDVLIGAVVERVRPARPNGHGAAWEALTARRADIAGWVKGGKTLVKIEDLLARSGTVVPYRTLHRFAVAECGFRVRGTTVRVADGEPGVECQIDFAQMGFITDSATGRRRKVHALILTAVYWWSYIGSELIYVGDSGAVEPTGAGKRHGYELTGFWKPNDWLALDAVWTGSTAHYVDLPEGENFVPGALESSGEFGASAIFPEWNASARLRYLGPHALIEDNSERGSPTLLVNLRAAWTPQSAKGWELYADLLNVFDSKADDIDYYYATRFPGEPVDGVEDINSRIVEPRQVRVGAKFTF